MLHKYEIEEVTIKRLPMYLVGGDVAVFNFAEAVALATGSDAIHCELVQSTIRSSPPYTPPPQPYRGGHGLLKSC